MELYTVKEVANILGCNTNTVYEYIYSGELKAIKLKTLRIKKEDFEEFLESKKINDYIIRFSTKSIGSNSTKK